VFMLSIVAFMSLRTMGVGPFGSLVASGKLKNREPLLITDFHITGADTSLGRVVSDAVRAGLSQSSVLALMSTGATAQALRLMEKPPLSKIDLTLARQLALRTGAKAIVDGDVTGVGGGYIVVLRLVTADSGTELWSARETGDGPRGLIDATDRLTRALRGKAGESLRTVQGAAPLAEVTTTSLDALKKYSEGARYHDVLADWPNAIAKFREAVAIDSNFAAAWRKLGAALGNAGRPSSETNAALEQAHRHRDHLTENERDYEEAFYYTQGPGGDRAKGIALYEALLGRGDPATPVNLALEYLTRRDNTRAESLFARGIRDVPGNALSWYEIAWPQANQGHWARAESSLVVAEQRFPQNSTDPIVKDYLLYHARRLDSLQHYVDDIRLHGRPDLRPIAGMHAADLALIQGNLKRALPLFAEATAANAAIGTAANVVADSASVTRMEVATLGDSPRGMQRMDALLAKMPLKSMSLEDRPYFSVARTYARLGHPDRARTIVAEFERDVHDTAFKRSHQPALHEAMGEIALAENKPAEAIVEFRRGDVLPDGPATSCPICLPVNLARAFDAAHQSDSAIVMYEKYITTPYIERLDPPLFAQFADPVDPIFLAGVRRRLGELYEAKGDTAKAVEHYQAFVEQWKSADPELQPRVAEARRRLQALTPVEKAARSR